MAEWLKAHDSKSCGQQCLGGSNPLASARKYEKEAFKGPLLYYLGGLSLITMATEGVNIKVNIESIKFRYKLIYIYACPMIDECIKVFDNRT